VTTRSTLKLLEGIRQNLGRGGVSGIAINILYDVAVRTGRNSKLQYESVRYNKSQYSKVRYSMLQSATVLCTACYSTVLYFTIWCCAVIIRYCTLMIRYVLHWYCELWYGIILVSYGTVPYGMPWHRTLWYGLVWYGMVWLFPLFPPWPPLISSWVVNKDTIKVDRLSLLFSTGPFRGKFTPFSFIFRNAS
jgi:hypothetical protein